LIGANLHVFTSSHLYTLTMAGMPMTIEYQLEPNLSAEEFIDVLIRSTLAERRPVNDRATIDRMLAGASVIVTARAHAKLVGVSRAISDFGYCTYLSDLAVDRAFQRQGIGRELIRRTHEAAGLGTTLILLSAPQAAAYYPHIGMTKHDSCWIIPRSDRG
jgi:GNAT superfamily N-acetyltransferase